MHGSSTEDGGGVRREEGAVAGVAVPDRSWCTRRPQQGYTSPPHMLWPWRWWTQWRTCTLRCSPRSKHWCSGRWYHRTCLHKSKGQANMKQGGHTVQHQQPEGCREPGAQSHVQCAATSSVRQASATITRPVCYIIRATSASHNHTSSVLLHHPCDKQRPQSHVQCAASVRQEAATRTQCDPHTHAVPYTEGQPIRRTANRLAAATHKQQACIHRPAGQFVQLEAPPVLYLPNAHGVCVDDVLPAAHE
jgi:hypothetical protein